MSGFERKNKYIVLRLKDLHKLTEEEHEFLKDICGKMTDGYDYVVVKETYPEYEIVWKAIEERVTNSELKAQGGTGCDVDPS